jgi:hypothetical protein
MAERPGLGLAMGIQSGLTALAAGIARRRQRTYETDQQERAAKAFNEYLRTGQVSPDMLNLAPGMINALTPQAQSQGSPEWVERPDVNGMGPAQLVHDIPQRGDQPWQKSVAEKPEKETAPSTLKKLLDERDALPEGDPRRNDYNRRIEKENKNSAGGPSFSDKRAIATSKKNLKTYTSTIDRFESSPKLVEGYNKIIKDPEFLSAVGSGDVDMTTAILAKLTGDTTPQRIITRRYLDYISALDDYEGEVAYLKELGQSVPERNKKDEPKKDSLGIR